MVAPTTGKTCQTGSKSDKIGKVCGGDETGSENEKTPQNTEVLRGFQGVVRAGLEPATPAFSVQCSTN